MKAFVGGSARELSRGAILIGGAQRRFTRVVVMIGGVVRNAARFTLPFSVSTPPTRNARAGSNWVATATVPATVSGGVGPYTYSWARVSGEPFNLSGTATATVSVSGMLGPGDELSCVVRVTATDALGSTAQSDTTVTLRNIQTGGLE